MSILEDTLEFQMKALKLPEFVKEFRFHPTRRWRADFAWPDLMLLVEVEGGAWGGRHTRGGGFQSDLEKYDAAMEMGYTVYRTGAAMIKTGKAVQTIETLINLKRK